MSLVSFVYDAAWIPFTKKGKQNYKQYQWNTYVQITVTLEVVDHVVSVRLRHYKLDVRHMSDSKNLSLY